VAPYWILPLRPRVTPHQYRRRSFMNSRFDYTKTAPGIYRAMADIERG
jgi:hypothetical protein